MKKLQAAALSTLMLCLAANGCLAEEAGIVTEEVKPLIADQTEDTENEINHDGSSVTEVFAKITSSYSVLLPKKIDVSGIRQQYTVKCRGDISSDEKLSVVPTETVTLSDQSGAGKLKSDVVANVSQTKETWNYNELDRAEYASAQGMIFANGLTAGNWSGPLSFTISVTKLPV